MAGTVFKVLPRVMLAIVLAVGLMPLFGSSLAWGDDGDQGCDALQVTSSDSQDGIDADLSAEQVSDSQGDEGDAADAGADASDQDEIIADTSQGLDSGILISPQSADAPTAIAAAGTYTMQYRAHVQRIGWQGWVDEKKTAGTTGKGLRMEALCIKVTSKDYSGSVQYRAYCAGKGWQAWQKNGKTAGTTGQGRQMEAVQIQLTGKMADVYDIYYRVHIAKVGWLDWTKNGASAGSTGFSLRMEAIQIKLVAKAGKAPGATTTPFLKVSYSAQAEVAAKGWLPLVKGRGVVGTTGQSRIMRAFKVQVGGSVPGGVKYCAHVQGAGWQDWVKNGAVAGTEGQDKRVEALRIKLTGEMASRYDVYYRAHVQGIGWMGWAKNGAAAGTAGLSLRMEAFEMVVVLKGAAAPGATSGAFRDTVLPSVKIVQDMRKGFVHGDKPAAKQKYIVLHDTEGTGGPASVISGWDSNGSGVAAHFVIGRDGTIYQCVPLDKIAHHAGYGDAGHNKLFGVVEDGRDDMKGTVWIGSWAPDYGMNAWSVGIELVHVGGQGDYPQAQLNALDSLIAYIDAYYGFRSTIIDHKAWRSGNSDTSPEFAKYLKNYKSLRHH